MADVLDTMGNPDATTLARLVFAAGGKEIEGWLRDRKNRRLIPHRLEQCGYVPIRNDCNKIGLWVINGERQVVYAKNTLSIRDMLKAARKLADGDPAGENTENSESSENPIPTNIYPIRANASPFHQQKAHTHAKMGITWVGIEKPLLPLNWTPDLGPRVKV